MSRNSKDRTGALASVIPAALMILGLLALYCPPALFEGKQTLLGFDHFMLHARRIRYAQEALFAGGSFLPAWYTRELMGTPFWSNVQSFPFLPTRLALLWLDPDTLYPVAVILGAVLAALFTYLYLRQLGLSRTGSAAAGWTFSASGYFASRMMAGQLPLLEVFAALPLLLWCLERITRSRPADPRLWRKHLGLALASLCVVLAGHPQIPAYALGAATLYAVVRTGIRRAVQPLLAIGLGIGLGGFVWWPMLRLIGRSARVLALEAAVNDVPFPYWRLDAFFRPWADGWPTVIERQPPTRFAGPSSEFFWDTVCYVGWVPLLAALVLLVRSVWKRELPGRPWLFVAALGVGSLLLSLPFAHALAGGGGGATLLRSPSRLLYFTTFALAAAFGVLVDRLLRTGSSGRRALSAGLAVLVLAAHATDLAVHDRHFVRLVSRVPLTREEVESLREETADRRIAMNFTISSPMNRQIDDVGFYDSIMLARPYRAVIAMSGAREQVNVQAFNGSILPTPALRGLCAHNVYTSRQGEDRKGISTVRIPDAARRATFFPDASVDFREGRETLERFRRGEIDLCGRMDLAHSDRPADLRTDSEPPSSDSSVRYARPDSDRIVVEVANGAPGFLRIMESWDEGWSATLDGRPADLLVADAFAIAVRLLPGVHEIRLAYRTPGARAGMAVTALSAVLLAILTLRVRSPRTIARAA